MGLKGTVLGALIVISLIAPIASVSARPGITACGVLYDCGAEDGVCPTEFGARCDAPDWCDEDCYYGEALENSDSECSDKVDNDCDSKKDCDDSYCAGFGDCVGEVVEAKEEPPVDSGEPISQGNKPAEPKPQGIPTIAIVVAAGGGLAVAAGVAYSFMKKK